MLKVRVYIYRMNSVTGYERDARRIELEQKKKRNNQEYMLKELEDPLGGIAPKWAVCTMGSDEMLCYLYDSPRILVTYDQNGMIIDAVLVEYANRRTKRIPSGHDYLTKNAIAWLKRELE